MAYSNSYCSNISAINHEFMSCLRAFYFLRSFKTFRSHQGELNNILGFFVTIAYCLFLLLIVLLHPCCNSWRCLFSLIIVVIFLSYCSHFCVSVLTFWSYSRIGDCLVIAFQSASMTHCLASYSVKRFYDILLVSGCFCWRLDIFINAFLRLDFFMSVSAVTHLLLTILSHSSLLRLFYSFLFCPSLSFFHLFSFLSFFLFCPLFFPFSFSFLSSHFLLLSW